MRHWVVLATTVALTLVAAPGPAQDEAWPPTLAEASAWREILAAEDARVAGPGDVDVLNALIRSQDLKIASLAIRALGRSERPSRCAEVIPLLISSIPALRIAATLAISNCYVKQPNNELLGVLIGLGSGARGRDERAALAHAIGSMTYEEASDAHRAEALLVSMATDALAADTGPSPSTGSRPDAALLVAALGGLESLRRRHAALLGPSEPLVELATAVVRGTSTLGAEAAVAEARARAKRLAFGTLLAARDVPQTLSDVALGDPDPQLRRLAALAVAREGHLRPAAWARAARDASPLVRHAALAGLARLPDDSVTARCDEIRTLAGDADPDVSLSAIDLLSRCHDGGETAELLVSEVAGWRSGPGRASGGRPAWWRPAHALVSLASVAPRLAAGAIPRFAADPVLHVRAYAARAAGVARDRATLDRLALDEDHNVSEAVIAALQGIAGHEADARYLEALTRDDYQLLITASRALEGTPRRADARAALRTALDRVTAQRVETSRDARLALLDRLGEAGDASDAAFLEPYLSDFDPVVAERAASVLGRWTGRLPDADPRPLPRLDLPTAEQLTRLFATRVVLHLRGLGAVELRLHAADAPLNAFRFVRLAEAGYYDGLTFHRVVPGFVVQGGSPGGNEYAGDGPFTRDELAVSNVRGAVGLSTRGRDTGDAQFYVNLVDNDRLDEDYTVFGEVVRGMDVVDRILEGDVIERVEVIQLAGRGM